MFGNGKDLYHNIYKNQKYNRIFSEVSRGITWPDQDPEGVERPRERRLMAVPQLVMVIYWL